MDDKWVDSIVRIVMFWREESLCKEIESVRIRVEHTLLNRQSLFIYIEEVDRSYIFVFEGDGKANYLYIRIEQLYSIETRKVFIKDIWTIGIEVRVNNSPCLFENMDYQKTFEMLKDPLVIDILDRYEWDFYQKI